MKTQIRVLALALGIGASLPQASALIVAVDLGTAMPPATLGGFTMTPFDPGAGAITGTGVYDTFVGTGWATWGQGYTGRVYVSPDGNAALTLTLSGGTKAVYFYMEPNQFADFTMTATETSGAMMSTVINGFAGSAGVGFYSTAGETLSQIVVTATDPTGFAIGNFGVDTGRVTGTTNPVPDAGFSLMLLGLGMSGLAGFSRFMRGAKA